MNNIATPTTRAQSYQPAAYLSSLPLPLGPGSEQLRMAAMRNIVSSRLTTPSLLDPPSAPSKLAGKPMAEQLHDALASFKIKTAAVAMHLAADDRQRLFAHLDSLFAIESWDADDKPATLGSFTTLLRMVLFLGGRRPALGATSDGNFIATWTEGTDRLTIECRADDQIRWILVQDLDGQRESAAGETHTRRLRKVLRPYDAPGRWFPNGTD